MRQAEKSSFDPAALLARAGKGRAILKYLRGDVICSQGETAGSVFYVAGGRIKTTVLSRSGKEGVLEILGEGDFLGLSCLAGETRRLTTATAITECTVVRLDEAEMSRMLRDEPEWLGLVISFLVNQAVRMQDDLIDHLSNSSEKRLARALLTLAHFGHDGASEAVISDVTQEMLAEMIGTTRSRVNTFMNKFRAMGFVDYKGELRVHRSLRNVILQDD
jgi:CRP-like cAMP-binding protein